MVSFLSKGVFITILFAAVTSINAQKLHVAIYYESLCGDSIRFITNQLNPAYEDLKNYIEILFVPFGKSWVSQKIGLWFVYVDFILNVIIFPEKWWRKIQLSTWSRRMCRKYDSVVYFECFKRSFKWKS